jgi:proteic killer suppression protein
MRFSDRTLCLFWKAGRAKGIDPRSAEHLNELLSALDAAARPDDMAQPGWDFHPLTGGRKSQYAVEVRGLFPPDLRVGKR